VPALVAEAAAREVALQAASRAVGLSDPNPRVGCVLLSAGGEVLATGHTQQAGGEHAEVHALRLAREAGRDTRGATAVVTLEPCSHHGRTPPCCDALVAAGIARVVAAVQDPNPRVAGAGFARLRAAGIDVDVIGGDWGDASRELNIGFFSRMQRGRPWVRMKIAASLDGRTALDDGTSQWITGEAARADGHAWRRRAGAVLTGIGTVRDDDPRLDVRLVPTHCQPLRVLVDSRLEVAPSARRTIAPAGRCRLSPVPELVAELAAGRMVVLVDEEDRENEGDLGAGRRQGVTPEAINFMAASAAADLPDADARALRTPAACRRWPAATAPSTAPPSPCRSRPPPASPPAFRRRPRAHGARRRWRATPPADLVQPATSSRCRPRTAAC
jgi:diaminohydroxyphosphoribosylaminopyrimidine deaminase/5-amino-6-(5-phosphoribosylamino)uracil reductase